MTEQVVQAIVLSASTFREYDSLLECFTKEAGLLRFIVKGAFGIKSSKKNLCQPFTYGEYVYRPSKNSLHRLSEGKVTQPFLSLRENFEKLVAASELVRLIARSQMPDQPAPELFDLLKSYLTNLGSAENPAPFPGSFYLKLLLHEGCLPEKIDCQVCKGFSDPLFFTEGSFFCGRHKKERSETFSFEELTMIRELVTERSFRKLGLLNPSERLLQKIKLLYRELH